MFFYLADEERGFLIAADLQFRTGETEGEPALIWRDLEGDVDEFYEFVARGANAPTLAFFETCMYRAMYERKYGTSADNTQDSDLQEFIWQCVCLVSMLTREQDIILYYRPPAKKVKGKVSPKTKGSTSSASKVEASPPTNLKQKPSSPSKAAPSTSQDHSEPATSSQSTTTSAGGLPDDLPPALVSLEAELHWFNREKGYFVHQADVIARIVQPPDAAPFNYWLAAYAEEGQVLAHRVSSDMNQRWSGKTNSITWNNESSSGLQTSWCLRFKDEHDLESFQISFTKALWETLNRYPWEKAKVCL